MIEGMVNGVQVSIIVPVYAVEKYLDACMDSIVKQSYENIEIILVNDRSPDSSGKICDDWAKKDSRVKVVHKTKNEGVNMARLTGYKHSKGQFITFVDSDDILHKDNVEQSLAALLGSDADVAVYAHVEFSDANEKKTVRANIDSNSKEKMLETKDEIARYAFFGDNNLPDVFRMTVWGKLYRRNIIKKVDWSLSNYRYYEDNFWIAQALLAADKIVLLSNKLVYYRRNTPYNHVGPSLSGQLIGNTKDGAPIGYLEQVKHLFDLDLKLAKKYGVAGLNDRLLDKYYGEMLWRIDGLSRAGLLSAENNLDYIPEIWAWFREHNNSVIRENLRLAEENASHLGVKRSARLLVGNVKRRIARTIRSAKR